jgi:AGZA family xanthine/uracil permease-like MFS transporter
LMADALGTTIGAMLGTSTVTTYMESTTGIAEGGRSGLTSVTTAFFFLLSLFFAPLFLLIPSAATTSALVIVGVLMLDAIRQIDYSDMTEALPAFVTIVMMPFAYSIAEGIVLGLLSYVVMKVLSGRYKQVSLTMYVLAVLFVLRYLLG